MNINIYSHIDIVSDEEALNTSKRLIREEGILCGISSGTNVCATIRLAKKLAPARSAFRWWSMSIKIQREKIITF